MEDYIDWLSEIKSEAVKREWTILSEDEDSITFLSRPECELYPKYRKCKINYMKWPSGDGMTATITKHNKYGESRVDYRCQCLQEALNIIDIVEVHRNVEVSPVKLCLYKIKNIFK